MSDLPPADVIADISRLYIMNGEFRFQGLTGGRTNRLWRIVDTTGKWDVVLKLYSKPDLNPLFPNDADDEEAALNRLLGSGITPQLLATGGTASGRWIIYRHVPGQLWRDEPERVAGVLYTVHKEKTWPQLRRAANGSQALAEQTKQILIQCDKQRRGQLQLLWPSTHIAPTDVLTLIHADPVPGNIVVTENGLCLIDWQCPALGDPAEDLAQFLSPGMQGLYGNQPLTATARGNFLAAYPNQDVVMRFRRLEPWFRWRNTAYFAWRVAQGDADYARAFDVECAALAKQTDL